MPIKYTVDHAQGRVCVHAVGDVMMHEIAEVNAALAAANVFSFSRLFDARDAVLVLTGAEVRDIAEMRARLRFAHGPMREAFVTASEVSYGLARMYEAVAGDGDVGFCACRSLAEAVEWLGWTEEETLPMLERTANAADAAS